MQTDRSRGLFASASKIELYWGGPRTYGDFQICAAFTIHGIGKKIRFFDGSRW